MNGVQSVGYSYCVQNNTSVMNNKNGKAVSFGFSPAKIAVLSSTATGSLFMAPVVQRLIDYYDADEIAEARDHHGVFRNPGEDSWEYEKRAREVNEAWERVQKQHEKKSSSWWPF